MICRSCLIWYSCNGGLGEWHELSTAKIVQEDEKGVVIHAEGFGNGVDM